MDTAKFIYWCYRRAGMAVMAIHFFFRKPQNLHYIENSENEEIMTQRDVR